MDAEDGLEQLGPPGAHEARQSEDLTAPHLEGHVAEPLAGVVAHVEDRLADGRLLLVEHVGQLAADHLLDEEVVREGLDGARAHVAPIAQDGDFVADVEHLIHLVGDVDDRDAPVPERADDVVQIRHLGLGDGRGGLVHDDEARLVGDRLGDLDQLGVGDGELHHLLLGGHGDPEPAEELPGAPVELPHVHQPVPGERLAPQEDVLRHRHVRDGGELLVDHRDAHGERVVRVGDAHLLAVELDGAGVGRVDPDEALHQGGLARPVLSHERMHGPLADVQLDLVQGVNAGEPLGDALHPEDEFAAHLCGPPVSPRRSERAGGGRSVRSGYFFMNDL